MKEDQPAVRDDGLHQEDNIKTTTTLVTDDVPRPKKTNNSRRKVVLMKEEDRKEMKKTTRDIRKMFQDKISNGGPTITPGRKGKHIQHPICQSWR